MAELTAESTDVGEVVLWNEARFTVTGTMAIREPSGTWVGINATGPLGEEMTFRPNEIQVRCHEIVDGGCDQWSDIGTDRCEDHN